MASVIASPRSDTLKVDKYTLTTTTFGEPLMATMNKYTSSVNGHIAHNAPAVILLLAHGVGCGKVSNF